MKYINAFLVSPFTFSLFIVLMLMLPVQSASDNVDPLGSKDLELSYGSNKSLGLFKTSYKSFIKLAGNTGVWEDENKYQYTWGDGQAAFIKKNEMKRPQLVQIILNSKFKTPRGIKKGSSLDDLMKAYSENCEVTEGGGGYWYTYKWTAVSRSQLINKKNFSISFYVADGLVDTVFLKLESEDTENIPVG